MPNAYAVIGANYGDEGKGVLVDYLCHREQAEVVVRTNGGAQAGHTVTLADGRRHVFHHVGAGAFAGAKTFLSRFFICNPILFLAEKAELTGRFNPPVSLAMYSGIISTQGKLSVTVDPACWVTTPWDMLLNQMLESHRGVIRHGSCGVGINETVERNQDPRYRLTVANLDVSRAVLRARMSGLLKHYYPARLRELSLMNPKELLKDADALLSKWLSDVEEFLAQVHIASQNDFLTKHDRIVFEGAQGLALDQNNMVDFPYLTRSNTGIKNVLRVCEEVGIEQLNVVYVSRSYATRHGAGPLPHEGIMVPSCSFDSTNVDHPYQGILRHSLLDIISVVDRIKRDLRSAVGSLTKVTPQFAMTWLGVLELRGAFLGTDLREYAKPEALAHDLANRLGIESTRYGAYSPTRERVQEFQ